MNLPANAYTLPNSYVCEDYWFKQEEIKSALFDAAFQEQIFNLTQNAWSFAAVISYLADMDSLKDNPLNKLLFGIYFGENNNAIRELLTKATNELAKHNAKLEKL